MKPSTRRRLKEEEERVASKFAHAELYGEWPDPDDLDDPDHMFWLALQNPKA